MALPKSICMHMRKKGQQEEELEHVFLQLQLKEKHGSVYSGPQLRLWTRIIIADS